MIQNKFLIDHHCKIQKEFSDPLEKDRILLKFLQDETSLCSIRYLKSLEKIANLSDWRN